MRYRIEKQGDEVVISFEEAGGEAAAVIEAIGRCRQSAGACTTAECAKIGAMDACSKGEALAVRLKPNPHEVLDVATIGECLKYQLPKQFEH